MPFHKNQAGMLRLWSGASLKQTDNDYRKEDLQMTVSNGVHQLVGLVSTGQIFDEMNTILK
ncbi:Hypothetical predicted protein, partial [Paramuricea clavata]